jgi:hypothetical protein
LRLRTKLDGMVVGGMSYSVDATLKRPPREVPPRHKRRAGRRAAEELLEALDLPSADVQMCG